MNKSNAIKAVSYRELSEPAEESKSATTGYIMQSIRSQQNLIESPSLTDIPITPQAAGQHYTPDMRLNNS